jgi:hypothetical protein
MDEGPMVDAREVDWDQLRERASHRRPLPLKNPDMFIP